MTWTIFTPILLCFLHTIIALYASSLKKITIIKKLYNENDKLINAKVSLSKKTYKITDLCNTNKLGDKIVILMVLFPIIDNKIIQLQNNSWFSTLIYALVALANIMLINDNHNKQYLIPVSVLAFLGFIANLVFYVIIVLELRIVLKKNKILNNEK